MFHVTFFSQKISLHNVSAPIQSPGRRPGRGPGSLVITLISETRVPSPSLPPSVRTDVCTPTITPGGLDSTVRGQFDHEKLAKIIGSGIRIRERGENPLGGFSPILKDVAEWSKALRVP